ncbi:MAG: hypothetical protein GTO63_01320 [Anaerolineae bacterium]|nr:hypothetical protein [Anaerolineae bacterium]NIN93695.1 hypothetical protein [Anaerolineae bacterium]NIQ76742.1 hypothetical protein [Anaerolineae bacterium]
MRLSGRLVVPAVLVVIALACWLPQFGAISREGVSSASPRWCGEGRLEVREGLHILHLRGGPYDIGYQHGVLLRQEIRSRLRDQVLGSLLSGGDTSHLLLLRYARYVDSYLPAEYRYEMRGLADGAGLSYSDVLLLNSYEELISAPIPRQDVRELLLTLHAPFMPHYGSVVIPPSQAESPGRESSVEALHHRTLGTFAAFGTATQGGRLLHAVDLSPPEPNLDEILIIVYEPDVGNRVIVVGRPGMVGATVGLNEEQISVVGLASPSQDASPDGVRLPVLLREVLHHAGDIRTSVSLIASGRRTSGYNVLIGDGKPADAQAVELSAHQYAVFQAENDLLVRTNHYLDPDLSETQQIVSQTEQQDSRGRFDEIYEGLYSDYGRLDLLTAVDLLAREHVADIEDQGTQNREPVTGILIASSALEIHVVFHREGKTDVLGVKLDEVL